MSWSVRVRGSASDLRRASRVITGPDLSLTEEDGAFFLWSAQLDGAADLETAYAVAEELVQVVSGAVRLTLGSVLPVQVDGLRDGAGHTYLQRFALDAFIVADEATVSGGHPTPIEDEGAERLADALRVALANPDAATALRRIDHEPNWTDLYAALEIVENDVGTDRIVARSWATRSELETFHRSANTQRASGDQARHGLARFRPPNQPMSLAEATSLVRRVVARWLS